MPSATEPIFTPSEESVTRSQLTAFARFCEAKTGRAFPDYARLYDYSVTEWRSFWALFLEWSAILVEGRPEPVCEGDECETAVFFPRLRLSYAENLLRCDTPEDERRPALSVYDETGLITALERGALRRRVQRFMVRMRRLGVGPGDRVAAICRAGADGLCACLAATALGATWSAVAPDMGAFAASARFRELGATWLVSAAEVATLPAIVESLAGLRGCILLGANAAPLAVPSHCLEDGDEGEIAWLRLPFAHPLFVLFSSGTTGAPKCIVHGAGGTLLEHLKEHRLHGDLSSSDCLFFQTSPAWMMWNWQLSALACGAEIVLFDGAPSAPERLWDVVSRSRATVFGTNPSFLRYCENARIAPALDVDLSVLRAVLSTGSILFERQYHWVAQAVKSVPLQSISGGTDIIGCFVLGNPNLPVYPGEAQCVGLGLDVRVFAEQAALRHGVGELVCVRPFPSRPLELLGDPDGRRFHTAYFSQHAGVWTHGDFVEIASRGTARILGRSDGVLNVGGIRIGPAEIYDILQDMPEVREAMAVEQASQRRAGSSRLVLLVVLQAGATLDAKLVGGIKQRLRERGSAAHVPSLIIDVAELPTTHTGKRSETAVAQLLNGRTVSNRAALSNAHSLDTLVQHPLLRAPY